MWRWTVMQELDLLHVYLRILVIINPFTAAAVYLSLVGDKHEDVKKTAMTSVILAMLLGSIVAVGGMPVLEALGIDLPSLSFGGGILLMVISVDMLTGSHKIRSVEPGEIAVVPLATPMMIGPGAITVLLHLAASTDTVTLLAGLVLAVATAGAVLMMAPLLRNILGMTGVKALSKIIALIIAAVAAEMIHMALVEWGIAAR